MPLFLILFVFGFIQWCNYENIRHKLFCWGFVLWTFLEVDWKLVFAVELSGSDCVEQGDDDSYAFL